MLTCTNRQNYTMNPQERITWLANRRRGIGGSDVAAILGLSPWKSPFQVYQEKRGEIPETPDNPAMLWGRNLESVIRQHYANVTSRQVNVVKDILVHPQHSFMLANVDGLTEDNRVLEIKTARTAQGWGEAGSDEIPQPYLLQVQHYLAVTSFKVADVAVLIGGSDFRLYEIAAEPDLQAMLIDLEKTFWQRVVTGEAPEPTTFADVQRQFGQRANGRTVEATPHLLDALSKLKAVREEIKLLEEVEVITKTTLMKAMGEAETLANNNGTVLATWRLTKPASRFDATAFKATHPDLYAAFLKEGEMTRRFLLK